MLNAPENLAYWYLRLNGFFLLSNFVVHRSSGVRYTSDADLLAIRMPHTYEPVGGQENDWDPLLFDVLVRDSIIGVICQVKGGQIGPLQNLFKDNHLRYCFQRLGFTEELEAFGELNTTAHVQFQNENGQQFQVAKILISQREETGNGRFLNISLQHVNQFIQTRIQTYRREKHQDWHFFSGEMQSLINQSRIA